MSQIDSFQGEWFFLNNYHPWPCPYEGMVYPSVEHAYQASKTLDQETRRLICRTPDPDEAKKIGRQSLHRQDWDEVKLEIMEVLVASKFRDPDFRRKLCGTGEVNLVEGNHWGDTFWGECDGVGQNHMGRILMEIRSSLQ